MIRQQATIPSSKGVPPSLVFILKAVLTSSSISIRQVHNPFRWTPFGINRVSVLDILTSSLFFLFSFFQVCGLSGSRLIYSCLLWRWCTSHLLSKVLTFCIRYLRRKRKEKTQDALKEPRRAKPPCSFKFPRGTPRHSSSRQNSPLAKRIRDWTTSGMTSPSWSFYLETFQVPMHYKTLYLDLKRIKILPSYPSSCGCFFPRLSCSRIAQAISFADHLAW